MCSAAQGRRAAKWGQAADSLPKWVRMRRPIALGGDGNPFTANQRLAVTPQRGAPSSRHEPPRAARRRALSQAAATAASAAPPPPRPLHRRRFSARMLPALAISSSPCARPSQRARPKNRHRARVRGWAPRARHAVRSSNPKFVLFCQSRFNREGICSFSLGQVRNCCVVLRALRLPAAGVCLTASSVGCRRWLCKGGSGTRARA